MAIIKCKMCGGDLSIEEGVSVAQCEYCGTQQTVPSQGDAKKLTLFARANRLRAACEFDKAAGVYESIVADFPAEAEAYWGLVLCRYGIEYVDDPRTGKKIPTCHRSSFDSVLDDQDFEQALENADVVARRVYREEAKLIETLRRGIVEVSGKEEPYDIFICYKETDESGNRTVDSVMAQDVYDALTQKGYRVFFSRITLEEKLGIEYEPYIFAALNSARLMLVFGTDYEHFNAVWVKNEWNRFLMLMEAGKGKMLIPCYKGIDAYDMPREFAKLQAQDMGKVGAMQDLLRGVDKIMGQSAAEVRQASESAPADVTRPTVQSLTERAHIFLEDGDFESASRYFDRVLDIEPKNAEAYFGKFLTQCGVHSAEELIEKATQFEINPQYVRIVACPEDSKRIEMLVERYAVEGTSLSKRMIYQELEGYLRGYNSASPYLEAFMQKQRTALDDNREFTRAEQYAKGEFAEYLAGIKKAITEPESLRKALEQSRYEDEKKAKDVCDGYLAFFDRMERRLAERREEVLKKLEENEANRKREAEIERKKTKRNRIIIGVACFMAIVAIIYAINVHNTNQKAKYEQAEQLLEEGRYDEAINAFLSLNGYKDSTERIRSARYKNAEALLTSGEYDRAISAFEELGSYIDASERALATRYEKAETLLASGDYDGAIAVFKKLGDYMDAQERVKATCYAKAENLLKTGNKAQAAIMFGGMGDYGDARTRSFELWNEILKRKTFVYKAFEVNNYPMKLFAAITKEGKIRIASMKSTVDTIIDHDSEWENLIDLAVAGVELVGLRSDGTVISTDGCGEEWSDVVGIFGFDEKYYSYDYVVGLQSDGTIEKDFYLYDNQHLFGWTNIVMVAGSISPQIPFTKHMAGLKADGTVISADLTGVGSDAKVEEGLTRANKNAWMDITSIVMVGNLLAGLKNNGSVVLSEPYKSTNNMSSSVKSSVAKWSDIVVLAGAHNSFSRLSTSDIVLMGVHSDGSIVLSNYHTYPALPYIVPNTLGITYIGEGYGEIAIYGLDSAGDPMIYTKDILDRWDKGELTDEEASEEAHHLVWGDIDFSTWKDFKLPN